LSYLIILNDLEIIFRELILIIMNYQLCFLLKSIRR